MKDEKATGLSILDADRNSGYGRLPIPSSRDDQIDDLLRSALEARKLSELRNSLDDGNGTVLRVFAERRATAAVRERKAAHLFIAGVALCVGCIKASREAIAIMPLLIHAADQIQVSIHEIAKDVRVAVGDTLAQPLLDFLTRAPADQSLAAMGYSVGADAQGFRYMRDW